MQLKGVDPDSRQSEQRETVLPAAMQDGPREEMTRGAG